MDSQSRAQGVATLHQIVSGMCASQALHVAAKLGIADHLARKPMDAGELAGVTQTDAMALHRLMRALCALDVFSESDSGTFSLNPAAEMLRSDVPGSYRAAVLFRAGDVRWRCWSDLLGTVRAGGGGAERILGMGLFEFYAAHPEESEIHDQAMRGFTAARVASVLEAMDFAQPGLVVDVGGGSGELLAAILSANPAPSGILLDLPHVVAHATQVLAEHGVLDRVRIVGGSFFEAVPEGGDIYLLKAIVHDWDDARATTILRNCRTAMAPRSRLLIIERKLPDLGVNDNPDTFLIDLEMLVMTPGGRERTAAQFTRLLSDAGFRLARIVPTRSPVSIFEAHPV